MTQPADIGWVEPEKPIRGLDHLGVQAPSIALYTQLLPAATPTSRIAHGTLCAFLKVERLWHTLDHADGLHADLDDPADRCDQNTRMVEPSMDRRLVHRAGREHLLAHSFARQYQRVKLLLRNT